MSSFLLEPIPSNSQNVTFRFFPQTQTKAGRRHRVGCEGARLACLSLMDCLPLSSSTGVNLGPKGRKEATCEGSLGSGLNFANIKWSREDENQEGWGRRWERIKKSRMSIPSWTRSSSASDERRKSILLTKGSFISHSRRRILSLCCCRKKELAIPSSDKKKLSKSSYGVSELKFLF